MYYNYHARITRLIKEGHLFKFEFLDNYNGIAPCLLLYFDNHRAMPIRDHKFEYYLALIKEHQKNTDI